MSKTQSQSVAEAATFDHAMRNRFVGGFIALAYVIAIALIFFAPTLRPQMTADQYTLFILVLAFGGIAGIGTAVVCKALNVGHRLPVALGILGVFLALALLAASPLSQEFISGNFYSFLSSARGA